MTTQTATTSTHGNALANWPLYASLSAGISAVLTAIGTFWSPLADYEATQTKEDFFSWLFIVGVIAVAVALVFGLVVRRATPENAARRAIVLAVLGVLSIVGFWTGLPMIFAGGAVCCALADRGSALSKVALVLGSLTTVAAVWLALAG